MTHENITVVNSIKENWAVLVVFFVAIYLISRQNLLSGYGTFGFMMLLYYIVHAYHHHKNNIITMLHKYHHAYNDYFSWYSGILFEFNLTIVVYLFYLLTGYNIFDGWIILFYTIYYSSSHNINYAILKVNKVHSLHHKYVHTNLGVDFLDVAFGTKNTKETCVENMNHSIPNIIIATIVVLAIKHLYEINDTVKQYLPFCLAVCFILVTTFSVISSFYLYFFTVLGEQKKQISSEGKKKKECKKKCEKEDTEKKIETDI